jgi:glycosyltransferase involved in cell wall biosynthesis/O-antigen/teichoic acid export membrane protein
MRKVPKYRPSAGLVLVIALMGGNFLNFFFNAYLGRILTYSQFAQITLFNTFNYLIIVFVSATSATINHRVAHLVGQKKPAQASRFFIKNRNRLIIFASIFTILFLMASPVLSVIFRESQVLPFILFSPMIIAGIITAAYKGYLNGMLAFHLSAIITIVEPATKLFAAIFLNLGGYADLVYLSLPTSVLLTALVAFWCALLLNRRSGESEEMPTEDDSFPKKFFLASVIAGLSSTAFLSVDVLLAKSYLSANLAGEYSILSLIGKMIYFIGSLLNVFIITLVSKSIGEKKNDKPVFYKIFSVAVISTLLCFIVLGVYGDVSAPLLLGEKAIALTPFYQKYAFGILLFTIANSIVIYGLAREQYVYPIIAIVSSIFMAVGISIWHASIDQITNVVVIAASINFVVLFLLHIISEQGRFIIRNLVDLVSLFEPNEEDISDDMSGKKILIFNWRDVRHSQAGGAEVYIHEIAKRWVRDGSKVTMFVGNDSHSPRHETIDGVHIVRRGGFYFVYFWAFLYYMIHFRGKYDVIIDCQNGVPFFASLYATEKTIPLIFHVHQKVFQQHLPFPLAGIAKTIEKKLMPFAYRHGIIITISDSTKCDLVNLGLDSKKIKIIYPGADLSSILPGEKELFPFIVYIGRLKHYKSIDTLINAFNEVQIKVPQSKLTIAGSGDELDKLKKLTQKLKISDKVTFTGRISDTEKVNLLQKAWVFVHPSKMEGWGITVIEANAAGTPVVASDVSGLRESVSHTKTGFLVAEGKHQQFAEKIAEIILNEELRFRLSTNSLEWSKRFDWEISAKKMMEIIYG